MVPIDEVIHQGKDKEAEYFFENVTYKSDLVDITANAKNSQFAQPLFEFSGACGGCGETPYIKLVTQLFGDRMIVANATGCSSIYGGSFPATPYTVNKEGKGPAWANSLFEDNAEFGYGMRMATETLRDRIGVLMEQAIANCANDDSEVKELFQAWLDNRDSGEETKKIAKKLLPLLEASECETAKEILKLKEHLIKRSQWIIGGDGWAYDIGYGGLDHVIANQEDVNILVLDTEYIQIPDNLLNHLQQLLSLSLLLQVKRQEEGFGGYCYELWTCLCSTNFSWSFTSTDVESD